jgi:hypothetical protein
MENGEQQRAEPKDRSEYEPEKILDDEGRLTRYKGRLSVIMSVVNGRDPTSLMRFYEQHGKEIVNYSEKLSEPERGDEVAAQFDYDANEARTFIKNLDEELAAEDDKVKIEKLREERINAFFADTRDEINLLEKKLGKQGNQTDPQFQ